MDINKIKKIAQLASRGEGGEKQNAIDILKRLGMSIAEIEDMIERIEGKTIRIWLPYKDKSERELAIQLLTKKLNTHTVEIYKGKSQ